jgi:hypothetical protein
MNSQRLLQVPFFGTSLYIVLHHNEPYVVMRPLAEYLGLAWSEHLQSLVTDRLRWFSLQIPLGTTGETQHSPLCLPLRRLPEWLTTIKIWQIKPEFREELTTYQAESKKVLEQYWLTYGTPSSCTLFKAVQLADLLNQLGSLS